MRYYTILPSFSKHVPLIADGFFVDVYNEQCTEKTVLVSQPRAFVHAVLQKINSLMTEANDTTELTLEYLLALMSF